MTCSICGSETQTGAKLCAHCRAARHRAFAETVTRPHPALAAVGAAAAGGGNNLELRLERAARKAAKRAWRVSAASVLADRNAATELADIAAAKESWPDKYRHAVACMLVVAIAGVLYVGYRILVPTSAPEATHESAAVQTASAGVGPAPGVVPQPATPAVETQSPKPDAATTRAFSGLVTAPGAGAAPTAVLDGLAGPGTGESNGDARSRANASMKGSKSARTKAPTPVPAAVEAPPPIAIVEPVVVVPVREAPKPDKWQLMSAALTQCGNLNLLARIACEQRVRLQYCDGAWGQVAQCVSGPVNDHGQ